MEEARALLELQQVDLSIIRDRRALEDLPETKQIQDVRGKLKELARRTTKLVGQLKDQQIELDDNAEKRVEVCARVAEVTRDNDTTTDFRRVKNNNAELDRLAKRLEKIDYTSTGLVEEKARLEALLEQAGQVKARLEAREAELVESLKEHASSIRDHLRELVATRESLVASVSEGMLERYARSCKAHGMLGVAQLEEGMCGACRVQLQPSQLDALRGGPDISTCPVCGRMLVVRTTGEH